MKKELADYLNKETELLKASQKAQKPYLLTDTEANLIKDILKTIGRDDGLNSDMAIAVGMNEDQFNGESDRIFTKLGNGRLTVES
jgi:hypothetical protein